MKNFKRVNIVFKKHETQLSLEETLQKITNIVCAANNISFSHETGSSKSS